MNLHEGGSMGETKRRYAFIRDMLAVFKTMAYSGRLLPESTAPPNFRSALPNSPFSS